MKRQAKADKLLPEWEEVAAVACAVQNMHLMATALGVACYWSSWHGVARDSPQMQKFLGLDDVRDRCLGFLVLGQTDKDMSCFRCKKGPIQHKVHWMTAGSDPQNPLSP